MPRRLAADTETLTKRFGVFGPPFGRRHHRRNSLRGPMLSSLKKGRNYGIQIEVVEHEFLDQRVRRCYAWSHLKQFLSAHARVKT